MQGKEDNMTEMTEEIEDLIYDKKERDIRMNLLAHRFLLAEDEDWRIVKTRLIELYKIYYKTRAVRLCVDCLTIYSSNRKMTHNGISVHSIFDQINPSSATKEEIAKFFAKNGRTKKDNEGNTLIGVPTFDHPCLPIYRFLDGSSIPQAFQEKQVDKEAMLLKVEEPLIITSTTEKMMLKQKERAKGRPNEQLGNTEKKKPGQFGTPVKKEKQGKYQQDISTSEMLSKRQPEKRNRTNNMQEMKVQKFDLKNTLKSPMKPPFIVSTATNSRGLLQGLIDDLNTK